MTIKERIEKLLLRLEDQTVAPVALAEYTTVDGTVIKCSGELAEGATIAVLGEGGETPAPDGVYELDNGKVLTVANGAITKVEEKAMEPTTEYALKADFDAAQLAFTEKITALEALVNSQSELIQKLTGQQKEALTLMQEFAAIEPAPTTQLANNQPSPKDERLAAFSASLQNLNKNK